MSERKESYVRSVAAHQKIKEKEFWLKRLAGDIKTVFLLTIKQQGKINFIWKPWTLNSRGKSLHDSCS
jgi:hypothetical protein